MIFILSGYLEFLLWEKISKNCLLLKKLIKIKKDQSDNESNAIDIDQCDNEIKLEEEVNKIESLSSEDEDLCCIAPNKKRARLISDFETESEDEVFRYTAPSKKKELELFLILKPKMI